MQDNLYTKEYFLSDCEGFVQFNATKGRDLSPRLKKMFRLACVKQGEKVLDIGCGRGELVLHCADAGADSTGIDSSPFAIDLAQNSFQNWIKKTPWIINKASFIQMDFASYNFEDNSFDLIFLSDIIEHLDPESLRELLFKANKLLKNNGRIIIHSSPNRIFLHYGLKLYNLLGRFWGKNIDWDMKSQLPEGLKRKYHVNEQTIFSLRKYFKKAGFSKIDLWLEKNPHYIYYFFNNDSFIPKINRLFKFLPIKHLFFADIYGVISK